MGRLGHLANSRVENILDAGPQQQFLYRHVHVGGATKGGAWSIVHVGGTGNLPEPSPGTDVSPAQTLVTPRVRLEKPYVVVAADGRFQLLVPQASERMEGVEWGASNTHVRDFSHVLVARDTEAPERIQEALDAGKDVVLSPGIYHLKQALTIHKDNQVVLGLGLATLVAPRDGSPCIRVEPNLVGVRIGGLMLEASEQYADAYTGSSLLQWGNPDVADMGNESNPGGLFDIFCRVGGATLGDRRATRVETMVKIHSGHIVGDNLWLWRADHAELHPGEVANYPNISTLYYQSEQDEFRVRNGLVVTGDNVTIYGLAVEHVNEYQTIWSGEEGVVAFFQSEYPYGVSADRFQYPAYRVHDEVQRHKVYAPGVYSNFRNQPVPIETAIRHGKDVHCVNAFTVKLDNNHGINSIVNGKGAPTLVQGTPMRVSDGEVATQKCEKVADKL